jgi:hypothetical protein
MTNRIQRAFAVFCIYTTITVGLLIAVEIAAFLAFQFHATVSSLIRLATERTEAATPSHDPYDAAYRGQPWAGEFLREQAQTTTEYAPYVVWQAKPFNGHFIVVGPDHLRRTMHSACRPEAYTIWLFGGSTMYGLGSPDWGTIPSWLARDYDAAGRPVCVRNYGQIGWASTQEIVKLSLELARADRKPDLAIFYDGVNEVNTPAEGGRIGEPYQTDFLKQELERGNGLRDGESAFGYLNQLNAVRLIHRLALRAGLETQRGTAPAAISSAEADRLAAAVVAKYRENMHAVQVLARGYGFKPLFFWQPALMAGAKPLTAEEREIRRVIDHRWPAMRPLFTKTYPLVQTSARPPLFYIADVFDGQRTTLFTDPFHVGPDANRIVAKRIYDLLRANGF